MFVRDLETRAALGAAAAARVGSDAGVQAAGWGDRDGGRAGVDASHGGTVQRGHQEPVEVSEGDDGHGVSQGGARRKIKAEGVGARRKTQAPCKFYILNSHNTRPHSVFFTSLPKTKASRAPIL